MTGVHQSDRETWLAARRELITASDVARLLGEGWAENEAAKAAQRPTLICEKAGYVDSFSGNETTELGSELELPLLAIAAKRFGLKIEPYGELLTHSRIHRLGATPDAFIVTPHGRIPVNAKVTTAQPPEMCKPKKDGSPSGAAYASGLPLYHRIQALAEAMVCGSSHGAMCVLHCSAGMTLRLYLQPRHSGLEARIEQEIQSAWSDVMKLREGKAA